MHEDLKIVTERLVLIPCPLEVADALVRGDRGVAEQLLGARLPDGWPDPEVGEILPLYADYLREHLEALGYGVHADHRNRGYATEAVRALVAWGLAQPGVTRVIAHCEPRNAPSLRVVAKAGMRQAGEDDGLTRWVAAGELGG